MLVTPIGVLFLIFIALLFGVQVDVRFKYSLGVPADEQSREWLKYGLPQYPHMNEAAIDEDSYAAARKRGNLIFTNIDRDHDSVGLIGREEPIFASEIGSFHGIRRVSEVNFGGLESPRKVGSVEYFYFNKKIVSSAFERSYLAFPIYNLNPLLYRSQLQVDLLLDSPQGVGPKGTGRSRRSRASNSSHCRSYCRILLRGVPTR